MDGRISRMPSKSDTQSKSLGLIGLYRCGNIGDEAIWQAFVQALRPILPSGWRIRRVTFGPGGFESGWGRQARSRFASTRLCCR